MPDASSSSNGKLSLLDASAMAMGGMIGGGIFAVLGEGVRQAGIRRFRAGRRTRPGGQRVGEPATLLTIAGMGAGVLLARIAFLVVRRRQQGSASP